MIDEAVIKKQLGHSIKEPWTQSSLKADAFFFNPDIADKYGFITCYNGEELLGNLIKQNPDLSILIVRWKF